MWFESAGSTGTIFNLDQAAYIQAGGSGNLSIYAVGGPFGGSPGTQISGPYGSSAAVEAALDEIANAAGCVRA